jgi:4-amino-4-deoxy-L-arabinose transferase-like glycosyltransferase
MGVVFRLLLIWTTTTPTDPLNHLYPGFTDGDEYMDNARSLVVNGVYGYGGRISAFRPPAYPFLIALVWRIFGDSLTPVRLVHIGLFVIMAILYIRVVARPFGRVAGVLAAGFLSLYPLFAFMSTEIATESLYMALESAVFAVTLTLLDPSVRPGRRTGMALVAGLCCGAGTLTRPNMYFVFLGVLILIAGVALWKRAGWRAWILPAVGLTIGTYAVVLPWMIRNERRLGAPVITTNLDYNFFRGTFDLVEGIPKDTTIFAIFRKYHVLYEQDIENPDTRQLPVGEVENEHLARSAALSIIRSDPGEWLWQRARNALYLWLNLQWDPDIIHKSPAALCAAAGVTGVYYLLLGGAIFGTCSVWRGREDGGGRAFVMLAWIFILMSTPTALTFVGKRYRVAMIDPYLALLCCGGVASWLRRRRGQDAPAGGDHDKSTDGSNGTQGPPGRSTPGFRGRLEVARIDVLSTSGT